jgi:hypothetical protein
MSMVNSNLRRDKDNITLCEPRILPHQVSLHLDALLLLRVGLLAAFPQGGVDLFGGGLLGFDDRPGDHAFGQPGGVVRNGLKGTKRKINTERYVTIPALYTCYARKLHL